MSDRPQSAAERQDAAATRRRWVTLAELVAVLGVIIGGLTLWNSWSERRAAEAEKAAAATSDARDRARFEIKGSAASGGGSIVLARDERHAIEEATVAFPSALGIGAREALTDDIQRDWLAKPLLKVTDGGEDDQTGRLPVLIAIRYSDGDATRTASGIYDIIWRTEGRVLRGRSLTLEGLRLRERGGGQKRLDALWAREHPARPKG